jgi:hypothetical protein
MSKFVSALLIAFVLIGTTAYAGIAIVADNGTSSGRIANASSYPVNLPTGVADGNLVVVAIASDNYEPISAEGYTARVQQGFKGDSKGCFEFYHVWKAGDSISPLFSRATTGSDAYAVVALSGVSPGEFVDVATGTSSDFGTQVNLPAITTHSPNDLDVYASCAEAGASFLNPSVGTVAVQQAGTSSSVAIITFPQASEGFLATQNAFMGTSLFNGVAMMALIAAPASTN